MFPALQVKTAGGDRPQDYPPGIHDLPPGTAAIWLAAGRCPLLDVRTPQEFARCHVPGSINIPWERMQTAPIPETVREREAVMVICRSGRRAARAALLLRAAGVRRLFNVGGLSSWPDATVSAAD